MKLTPLADRVVLKPTEAEETTIHKLTRQYPIPRQSGR